MVGEWWWNSRRIDTWHSGRADYDAAAAAAAAAAHSSAGFAPCGSARCSAGSRYRRVLGAAVHLAALFHPARSRREHAAGGSFTKQDATARGAATVRGVAGNSRAGASGTSRSFFSLLNAPDKRCLGTPCSPSSAPMAWRCPACGRACMPYGSGRTRLPGRETVAIAESRVEQGARRGGGDAQRTQSLLPGYFSAAAGGGGGGWLVPGKAWRARARHGALPFRRRRPMQLKRRT